MVDITVVVSLTAAGGKVIVILIPDSGNGYPHSTWKLLVFFSGSPLSIEDPQQVILRAHHHAT
jgi:hypothetical protein